ASVVANGDPENLPRAGHTVSGDAAETQTNSRGAFTRRFAPPSPASGRGRRMKKLIVTADDVGLHRGMTEGAIRAHRDGIVTACSIVANGRDFDDAVARLRDVPSLEAGVHLTMVEEIALTTRQ